jgi:O-antigen ligase
MATFGYRALSTTRLVGSGTPGFLRIGIWEAAGAAIVDRPFLGFGFGNVERAIGSYFGTITSSHNILLEVALSTGLLGAAALFGYWAYWLARLFESRGAPNDTDIATAMALLVAMFVMGLTLHGIRADELWLALAFAPVVVALARPREQATT